MKKLFSTLALAVSVSAIPAFATPVTVSLANPNQIGSAGQTLQYYGVITNNTGSTVFLNGDSNSLAGTGITTTDNFYSNAPLSLDAGTSTGLIDLFDVALRDGFSGLNLGTLDILGGADDGASSTIGSTTFSVAPTPEPASIFLLLTALPGAILPVVRRMRR